MREPSINQKTRFILLLLDVVILCAASWLIFGSILPPDGVYVVRVQCGARWWRGVANIGRRPTFRDTASTTVEVHLLQFDGRLYGRTVTVEWLHRRRPEQAFATTADLRRQIATDIDEAKRYFRRQPSFMSLAPARNSQ